MTDYYQFELFKKHSRIFQATSYKTTKTLADFLQKLAIVNHLISNQVHQDKIFIAENTLETQQISGYDGLITRQKNLALIIKSADCCPLLIYDRRQQIIAALHAGQAGTKQKIAAKCIQQLINDFSAKPQDLLCTLGPCICNNCYQINRQQDLHYDLLTENLTQLQHYNIPENNIEINQLCTACSGNDRFFSYRQDKTEQRTYSLIMLK